MRFVRFASCFGLVCTLSGVADAQLAVVERGGDEPSVERAELAYATGDGPPVTWISLRLRRAPVALIAAISDDARAEAAPDAWFDALEVTASPRVLAPSGYNNCQEPARSLPVVWPRDSGAAPSETVLTSAEDVAATLAEQGLTLSSPLPAAARYVVWTWSDLEQSLSTRTLRVSGGPAPLALLPGTTFLVSLSAVTRGPMVLPGERPASELDLSYIAGDRPRHDYREQLDAWLGLSRAPVLETRTQRAWFDWSIQADFSIAPLVTSYAQRAASQLPNVDSAACIAALRAADAAAGSEPAACGAAQDGWLALQTAPRDLLTLQRWALSSAEGFDPGVLKEGGEPRGPALRAQELDDSACPEQTPPTVVTPPTTRPIPVTPPSEDPPVVVTEEHTVVVEHYESTEVDCSGSPGREPDDTYESEPACSSDSSRSSYDDSSDDAGCASDSSSSSYDDSDNEDCSSDSSGSSSADRDSEDCSSDSSSSSSSSDSDTDCSGGPGEDDDDGYDGDTTCSVHASAKRVGRPRGTRLKTSLWSVVFAGLALTIRRRKRGARAGH